MRIDHLKNFGHAGETNVVAPGINGKMSEFNAALGLLQLKHVEDALAQRRVIDATYRRRLASVRGITCLAGSGESVTNCAYFPILVGPDFPINARCRLRPAQGPGHPPAQVLLPADLGVLDVPGPALLGPATTCRWATKASHEILCLPIYPGLETETIDRVCDFLASR